MTERHLLYLMGAILGGIWLFAWMIALSIRDLARSLKDFPTLVDYCRHPCVYVDSPIEIYRRSNRARGPITLAVPEPSEEFGKSANPRESAI